MSHIDPKRTLAPASSVWQLTRYNGHSLLRVNVGRFRLGDAQNGAPAALGARFAPWPNRTVGLKAKSAVSARQVQGGPWQVLRARR